MNGSLEMGKSMTDTAGHEQLIFDLWAAHQTLQFALACVADAAKVLQVDLDKIAAQEAKWAAMRKPTK